MRTKAKTDRNQAEIVAALRKAGVAVVSLHAAGKGCPDLLCGYHGLSWLVEVKDGTKPPSARRLTKRQQEWRDAWRGSPVFIVTSVDEALAVFGIG